MKYCSVMLLVWLPDPFMNLIADNKESFHCEKLCPTIDSIVLKSMFQPNLSPGSQDICSFSRPEQGEKNV